MYFIILILFIEFARGIDLYAGTLDNSVQTLKIPAVIADFGYVPYGKQIKGGYVYIEDICNSTSYEKQLNQSSIVVTEDKNNCSYAEQALKVQQIGSPMMVLIDQNEEKIQNLEITTDHFNQISIPTIMITNKGGKFLKKYSDNVQMILYIKFELNRTQHVQLDYYMVSYDNSSYIFLQTFAPYAYNMQTQITITPQFIEYSCQSCVEKNFTVTNNYCISGGRYCSLDPDGDGSLIGRDVVLEDLRQLCIYQNLGMIPWLKYAVAFSNNCLNAQNSSFLVDCSYQTMTQVHINGTNISNCVNTSFDGPDPLFNDSTVLAKQSQRPYLLEYMASQALFINQMIFKGDLYMTGSNLSVENYGVLEAVCQSFEQGFIPDICNIQIIGEPDFTFKDSQNNWIIWISIVVGLLIFLFVSIYLVRRIVLKRQQNELKKQVDDVMSNYYKMNSEKKV